MEHLIFHVLLQYKGKGILVFPILIACVLLMLFLAGFVIEEVLVWKDISRLYYVGIGFWLAGTWLWFIKDSFYINEYGEKVLIDELENSFWFMPMSYWSRLFGVIGALVMLAPFA